MKEIYISEKKIGPKNNIFLIAEAGINHNGDIEIAKNLIDLATDAKVDAIKFQTFIAENLASTTTLKAEYQKDSIKDNESFYEMIKKFEFSKEDFRLLKKYCVKRNIIFLSTPYDEVSVNWLEDLGVPAYKIGSGDLTNFPLIKHICLKSKPILLSTGMSTLKEVKDTVNFIKSNKVEDIIIFQCTSNYPSNFDELNLNVIDTYKKEFPNDIIGFSDHSLGIEASIGAAVKGVKVIEKHFTISKKLKGPDHKVSLNPEELEFWVKSIRNIEKALGSDKKKPSTNEINIAKIARKSIVAAKNIHRGEILTSDNITTKRPGTGISPTEYFNIINKKMKSKRDISKDTIINPDDLE